MTTANTAGRLYEGRLRGDDTESWKPFAAPPEGASGKTAAPSFRLTLPAADGAAFVCRLVIGTAADAKGATAGATRRLHVVMQGGDGIPYRGRRYRIDADGKTFSGTTDDTGLLDQLIPQSAAEVTLTLLADDPADELTYHLQFGSLPPVSEVAGLQARLNALGYHAGSSGALDEDTLSALKEFQEHSLGRDHPSGDPDDETRAQLDRDYAAR